MQGKKPDAGESKALASDGLIWKFTDILITDILGPIYFADTNTDILCCFTKFKDDIMTVLLNTFEFNYFDS